MSVAVLNHVRALMHESQVGKVLPMERFAERMRLQRSLPPLISP